MLLDELMQKGWGLGSGVSLFILAGVAQTLAWNTFSIVPTGDGLFGAIPHLITSAIGGNPWAAWIRPGTLPSLIGLILTIVVVLVIVYIEGLRIEVPIRSTKYSGFAGVYPLKLLYVSNLPIILVSALLANLGFLSQFIWTQFNPGNTSPLVSLLVMYNTTDPSQGLTGGLMYYINSPQGFSNALADPLRAVTYMIFVVIAAILFARIWVEIGGLSPSAAAKSLIDADVQIPGFRRTEVSIESILARHIPVITFIGGLILGLVASVSDIMGVFGSGTGILLSVGIVMQYYQLLVREHLETMMPRLGALLGRV
jgi:preprotein translocase subunit SecY